MFRKLRTHIRRFFGDETAPSAIEYAMLVAGVAVIIIAVVYMLGSRAQSAFDRASPSRPTQTTSGSAP
jgi:Flp pilus assembly pilin Flp